MTAHEDIILLQLILSQALANCLERERERETKENKAYIHAKACTQMFIETLFATVKHRAGEGKSSSRGK